MMSSSCVPSCACSSGREAHHLLARRRARRHGIAVAVVVGRRLRRREAHRARVERVVQQCFHRVESARRSPPRRPRRSPITTRRNAECPHKKPAFTRCPTASTRSRYSANVFQSHGTPCCSAGSGMPSTRAISRDEIVDVLVAAGREREPAVAAEHRRHAVHRRRARGRVPQQLRVVVRVQVDEARARRRDRRRRSCASRCRRACRSRRRGRRRSRRRRAARARRSRRRPSRP